jgi:hypothetical protein
MLTSTKDENGVAAALHLPHGKIFLGYPVKPYKKQPTDENEKPKARV